MKSKISFLLLLAASCFYTLQSCQSSSANDSIVLKFNLQKGKTYLYSMVMDMETEVDSNKMRTAIDAGYEMKVLEERAGIKTINIVYKRMAMRMDMPGMNVNVDTDKPVADTAIDLARNPMGIMNGMFKAMVGKSFTMKVDAEGRLLEISGIKEMTQAMLSSINVSEEMRPTLEQAFTSQFNEDNIRQSFSQAFTIFPNKAVKPGDTWEKAFTMAGRMAATVKTKYTVQDIQKNIVKLQTLSDIEMKDNAIKQTGTMEVDAASGLVLNANFEQSMSNPVKLTTKIKLSSKEL